MKPSAREDHLVVRELLEETLVYDLETDRAHCLSPIAARVWRLCDGKRTVSDLASRLRAGGQTDANEDMVWIALERLGRSRLLRERPVRPGQPLNLARRRVVMRGLRAAGLLPFIISIVAPTASQAQSISCTQAKCTSNNGATCSGCLNARCSDAPGTRCTRAGNECNCR